MTKYLDPGDPAVPSAAECVLERLLVERADETPDKVLVRLPDGQELTYATVLARATTVAKALHARGVRPGDHVLVWLPNGADAVDTVYGCALAGVVIVPISIAYKGALLEHVVNNSQAKVGIVHGDLLPRLGDIECPELSTVIITRGATTTPDGIEGVLWEDFLALGVDGELPATRRRPQDPWAVIYTSGTTGPSKGVVCSSVLVYTFWTSNPEVAERPGDRSLVTGPMSHLTGIGSLYRSVLFGSSLALVDRFETSRFWEMVAETGATMAMLVGAQCSYLIKAPPHPASKNHRLRQVSGSPLTEDFIEFGRRFSVDMATGFAMTEIPQPLVSVLNPTVFGSCGRVRPGAEVRLVDADGNDVPVGAPGEMLVRMNRPFSTMLEYLAMLEETAHAWRGGWFHTGDALRADEDGNFFYVDRVKDALRCKGENISSFEVESELLAQPEVALAAAVGVPNETGDQDLLAVLQLQPGAALDERAFVARLADRMPHYMVPRYIRIIDQMPLTATQRVQKHLLRSAGITPDTWDRLEAGLELKGTRL